MSDPARTATVPPRRASETARRDKEGTKRAAATGEERIDEDVVAARQVVARLLPEDAASEVAAGSGARRVASMVGRVSVKGRRGRETEK